MCVNTKPKRNKVSKDPREVIVAAHQSGKGNKTISKQLESIILYRQGLFIRIYKNLGIAFCLAVYLKMCWYCVVSPHTVRQKCPKTLLCCRKCSANCLYSIQTEQMWFLVFTQQRKTWFARHHSNLAPATAQYHIPTLFSYQLTLDTNDSSGKTSLCNN